MVDSETRWRLVRKQKLKGPQPETPIEIRDARAEDLPAIKDLYNSFIRDTVGTCDDKPLDLRYWQEKFGLVGNFELPCLALVRGDIELVGFADVAPLRQRSAYLNVVENSI